MPPYMDAMEGLTAMPSPMLIRRGPAQARRQESEVLFDEGPQGGLCLCAAPSREAAEAVHRQAYGLVADEIVEVKEGT